MRYVHILALAGTLGLIGCASVPNAALVQPIGPAPTATSAAVKTGWLRVYSAREPAVVDPNLAERLWNEDLGKNDFLYEPTHTDYTIYFPNGAVVEQVHNATGHGSSSPALVTLPPGEYTVAAQVEEGAGGNADIRVPVVIEPGKRTTVHLAGEWKPTGHYNKSEVVQMPDGRLAGWRADETHREHIVKSSG